MIDQPLKELINVSWLITRLNGTGFEAINSDIGVVIH